MVCGTTGLQSSLTLLTIYLIFLLMVRMLAETSFTYIANRAGDWLHRRVRAAMIGWALQTLDGSFLRVRNASWTGSGLHERVSAEVACWTENTLGEPFL